MRFFRLHYLLLPLFLAMELPALAADDKAGDAKPEASETTDPYNRGSPRELLIGLLDTMVANDFARLARYLEIEDPDTDAAADKARAFKYWLDEDGTLLPSLQTSILPEGAVDDGLPSDEEQLGVIEYEGEKIQILARRTEIEDGLKIWRVAQSTLSKLPAKAPADMKPDPAHAKLLIFGAPLGDWLIMLGAGLVFFLLTCALVRGIRFLVGRPLSPVHRERFESIVDAATAPLALFVAYLAVSRLADPLGADIVARAAFNRLASAVGWFAAGWFLWRLIGATAGLANSRLRHANNLQGVGAVNFVARLARFLLAMLGIAVVLSSFGIDVTAGLAALGVGGLALALGARKLVENFIGSLSVLIDKPVRIGDTCRFEGIIGEVDDIGMRSTRIRTRDRTMLTIPNARFSECEIENLSLRDRFLVDQTLGIAHDTPPDRVELALGTLRACLDASPYFVPKQAAIRLRGFGEGCLNIQIYAQLACASYTEGFMRQEELLLAILKRFAELGIAIALPARRFEMAPRSEAAALAAAQNMPG